MRTWIRLVAAGAWAVALASPVASADLSWTAATGGSYEDPASWSAASTPGPSDRAFFALPDTYDVLLHEDRSVALVEVSAGEADVDLGGKTLNVQGLHILAPFNDPTGAKLTLRNGTLETTDPTFVEGTGSLLRIGEDAHFVGGRIVVGQNRGAFFEVVDGGVASNTDAMLGDLQCCPGAVATVDGAGSEWHVANRLVVGGDGHAFLNVQNGGLLTTGQATVSDLSGSAMDGGTATVTGAGSHWINDGDLTVGGEITGNLNVEAGGLLETGNAFIGYGDEVELGGAMLGGSAGIAVVTGAGSELRASNAIVLGGDTLGPAPTPGRPVGGFGDLLVANGAHAAAGQSLLLWNASTLRLAGGAVDVGSGSSGAAAGEMLVHEDGRLGGMGRITGDVTLRGALDPGGAAGASGLNPHVVSAGDLARRLEIAGAFRAEDSAQITFDLAGEESGKGYDLLAVSGETVIAGALHVTVLPALVGAIAPSDVFTVLTAGGGLSGAFANVASGGFLTIEGGGGIFQVLYGDGSPFDPDSVVLTNFAAVPEPATLALVGIGLAAVAGLRVRSADRRVG